MYRITPNMVDESWNTFKLIRCFNDLVEENNSLNDRIGEISAWCSNLERKLKEHYKYECDAWEKVKYIERVVNGKKGHK